MSVREFMSRVVPWPADQSSAGYVNLVWTPGFTGKPYKTIDEFERGVAWAKSKENIKDLFYCLSLQAETTTNQYNKIIQKRHADKALALRSIWLDIDVKAAPKGYPTLGDAMAAVQEFCQAAAMPPPSALVHSGSGLHVYWISDRALSKAEWEPYAWGLRTLAIKHELRCDAGVTIDAARILRVPDTFNHKTTPPKPVRLLGIRPVEQDYDFAFNLKFLAELAPANVTAIIKPNENLFLNGPATPSAALALLPKESLSEGISNRSSQPLKIDSIVKGCAFIKDALLTGGKDYSQPMWNLTTLAATFMEHGNALAHRMGSAHRDYTPESTNLLWERKNRERKDRDLGFPSCSAIQTAGCTSCKACPHFGKIKSPLSLGSPVTTTEVDSNTKTPFSLGELNLPYGYVLKGDFICAEKPGKKEEDPPIYLQLFFNKVFNPWVSAEPKGINFTITTDKGHFADVSLPLVACASERDFWDTLYSQGLTPDTRYASEARRFMVAWLAKIQNAKEATASVPFGWWHDAVGKRRGFAFGGTIFRDDGSKMPAGYGDETLRRWYTARGSRAAWEKAAALVVGEDRPELDCILASAFAGPLAFVPGEYSSMLSVFGESGGHKTTATRVAMAVWSNPKMTKEVANTTAKSIIKKMGDLRNIPIWQDDIKGPENQKNVYETLFAGTEGIEGGRLTTSIKQQKRGDWQTMITICSNHSFADYVNKRQKTTDAGLYRMFEFEHNKVEDQKGRLATTMEATRILTELEHNFGVVGMEYAQMLGSDPEGIDRVAKQIVEDFALEVKARDPERFWVATCGTLLAGAEFGNRLGLGVDVPRMRAFLIKVFMENRAKVLESNTKGGSRDNTGDALTGFLKHHIDETLWTTHLNQGRGKPATLIVQHGPSGAVPRPINVHWATEARLLVISVKAFNDYLDKNDTAPATVMRGLKDHYKMERTSICMGAGTRYHQTQEAVMRIPVPPGSPLEPVMNVYQHKIEEAAA